MKRWEKDLRTLFFCKPPHPLEKRTQLGMRLTKLKKINLILSLVATKLTPLLGRINPIQVPSMIF